MRYLFVLSALYFASLAYAEDSITGKTCGNQYAARVISLQGKLYYDLAKIPSGNWQEARLNDSICEGSRVKMDSNSRASIRLSNGVTVKLAPNTIIALKEIGADEATWLTLVRGFLHTISRTPKRLTIETPIANAGPEGTEFVLSVDENQASVWVYEGGVKLYNDKGDIKLKPGQSAQAQLGQAPQARVDMHPQDAVNWALYYPPILPQAEVNQPSKNSIDEAVQDFRHGRIESALTRLNTIPPTLQTPYYYKVRAAMLLTIGQEQAALQDINRLLTLKPNDAEALALKSIRSLTQNRKDEAYTLAQKAVAAKPKSASAYSALSYVEQSRFNLEKAQSAADKAVELAPGDALAWARKAELELSQGLTTQSLKAAEKAIALDPNLERTQTIIGFSDLLRTKLDKALLSFNKAVELDSTSPLARLGLGLTKIRGGDLEAGRQDLESAAILDPNNSMVRSYLGKAYYEERRGDMADEQFRLAKERDPKDPTPYLYDAIHKQTTNRPVEALRDMQTAIELNDNRAVYRSKLALDKDTAARQVGLGRIFTNLGFDDPANRQAMKSLAIDPGNYSAHRLLSDSYATRPRHEIARASEHLQSQLLQPLNYNPIQPSLAYTDLNIIRGVGPNDMAFNEYNRLFERNGIRLTTTGIAGSNSTYGDEAALSGIWNKFSFSLGQLHYQTNGFRKNNDLEHNIYNAFAQYEITPAVNVQAEYRHRETNQGYLALRGNPDNFDLGYHRSVNQDSYRYGMKFSPTKSSDLLFSFIHSDRTEKFIHSGDSLKTRAYDIETQYLFHNDFLNTILGAGFYDNDNKSPGFEYNVTQYFGYLYSNLRFIKNLNLTAGLSFDHYKENTVGTGYEHNELNPKLGFIWKINNLYSLRAALFKTVKSAIIVDQMLQPTQIAGFNQYFDDINGTVAWQYGIGLDAHPRKDLYIGIEAYKRDLKIPTIFQNFYYLKPDEELYRLYFNWTPHNNWAFNSEFRFERYHSDGSYPPSPELVESAYFPTEIRFFLPSGFFATFKGTYVNQKVIAPIFDQEETGNFHSNFYLVDAALGYRFPKQYGLVSFEVKNLFDTSFRYRDRQYQMNELRSPDFFPERMVFGKLTLNF